MSGRRCQIQLTSKCELLHDGSVDSSAVVAQDCTKASLRSKDNCGVGIICWSLRGTVCETRGG